jgi:hypothetical protein
MATLTRTKAEAEPDEIQYFTAKEGAAKLRVSERWLREGFNHHGFPGARMGGGIVFNGEDLAAIYQLHRVQTRGTRRRRQLATV